MILSELSLVLDVTEKKEWISILALFTEKNLKGINQKSQKMTFLIRSLENEFF